MNKNLLYGIILSVIVFIMGYVIGLKLTETKYITRTEYVTCGPIKNLFTSMDPIEITTPDLSYALELRDTIWKDSVTYIIKPIDSLEIVMDWLSTRRYEVTLFDSDTLGNLILNLSVHKNQLDTLSYVFTPVIKSVVVKPKPTIELFGGVGVATSQSLGGQVGLFYNNWGGSYQFIKNLDTKSNSHMINLLYKFKL